MPPDQQKICERGRILLFVRFAIYEKERTILSAIACNFGHFIYFEANPEMVPLCLPLSSHQFASWTYRKQVQIARIAVSVPFSTVLTWACCPSNKPREYEQVLANEA